MAVLDADWHSHITMAGNNARLHAMWTTSNGPLRVLFARAAGSIYRPEQVRERHATLLTVLRTGDPWTIEQSIREHYLSTARHLAAHVEHGNTTQSHSGKEHVTFVRSHTPGNRVSIAKAIIAG